MKLTRHCNPGRMLKALRTHLYPRIPETREQAREMIRAEHRRGDSVGLIARRHGIDPAQVDLILAEEGT